MDDRLLKDDEEKNRAIRPVTLRLPEAENSIAPKRRQPSTRRRPLEIEAPPVRVSAPVPRPRLARPVPLIYKTLEEALEGCREKHPLPTETLCEHTPSHATWLSTQLKQVKTRAQLEHFADSLSYRDLCMLFPTLAALKRRDELAQIQNLIRLRACHYLYLCGWLTLQQSYPRSSVAEALSDLCVILEDMRFVRDSERQKNRRPIPLPVISIGSWRVIWSRVPLISDIALPNSRHFISDIAGEIYDSGVDLFDFYLRYAIFPDLPLGEAITKRYNELVSGVSANPLLSSDFFDRFRTPGH
ncbi:MAG: hypothetical protein PHC72_01025 [Eubacteriales bacterium]|nr:hypothetical protein [Eubacteriales bacterium]